jgi:dTDP-4-dehydrorhamnose 3,5-epimerase
MSVRFTSLAIPEVKLIEPVARGDARGFFVELFREAEYAENGVAGPFVQDNLSLSKGGVVRGLHLQNPSPQAKLVSVLRGEVFDVAVDVRPGSPTFGRWVGEVLSLENHRQLFVPAGFAHGFAVLSEEALFCYKCSDYYNASGEITVLWNDPDIGIEWPLEQPTLSEKDQAGLRLRDIPLERLTVARP